MSDIKLRWAIIFLLLKYAQAQDPNCSFTRYVTPDSTLYVYSPGYDAFYKAGVQCRWIATCPTGYNCRLDCPDIDLPQTQNCYLDRFLISLSGDPQLSSADYYCGRGSLSGIVSTGQQISMALLTSINSPGGRLSCRVTAQRASTPTPPPTTCQCGYRRMNRIVGGSPTKPNEFTMMAGIAYVGQNVQGSIRCGGVIITNQHILTAAHCVSQRPYSSLAVIVGEHDVSTGNDTDYTQGFRVSSYVIHPDYNEDTLENDIAIIKIQGTIVFSEYVGPVCLPFKYASASFAGETVTMLGWGTSMPGGPKYDVLQMVNVDVTTQAKCQSVYSTLKPTQICTYTPGKDACQDDSGGPVLYTDKTNGRLYSAGIISYGRFCASGYPGVNTRVTAFLNFITTNAPYNYCKI
ncbi:venom serine protease-like [Epargyreus clarus]|uniref:venom serine protease-like n=1 Tax=Epargyreus clarus TaxID=520877 RepID=UPI003C2B4D3E